MQKVRNSTKSAQIKSDLIKKGSEIQILSMSDPFEARELASKVVVQAVKNGVYSVCIICYKVLIKHYQFFGPKRYVSTNTKKLEKYINLENQEFRISQFYCDLSEKYYRIKRNMPRIQKKSASYIEIVDGWQLNAHGPYFYHKYFLFLCLDHQLNDRHKECIKTCEEALSYFDDKPIFTFSKFFFTLRIADCHFCMGDFDEADNWMRQTAKIKGYGEEQINYEMLKYHLDIIQGREPNISFQPDATGRQRRRHLLNVYNHLAKGVHPKYWGDISMYQRDATGMGISYNIARLWDHRLKGDVIPDEERMTKYLARHELGERDIAMIMFLLKDECPKEVFDRTEFDASVEIIPYEVAVDMINGA